MIKTTGQAILKSARTGETFAIEPSELQWQIGDRGDKRIGNEVHHVAHVERTANDGSTVACQWSVAEFPPGKLSHAGHHSVGGSVTQNFSFALLPPARP
jgi:hypothetical protein